MKGQVRIGVYLIAAFALVGLFLAGGEAWARPPAKPLGQTVPRPTPTLPFIPTVVVPSMTPAPGDTPAPDVTPTPPTVGGVLELTKVADRTGIWPGMTVTFTVTLTNTGSASLRQVTIEDRLPEGLEASAILAGTDALWDGRVLRASALVLPPGGTLRIVYTARARADLAPGAALVNRAVATAADGQQAVAFVVLGQPPLELPRTGGTLALERGLR